MYRTHTHTCTGLGEPRFACFLWVSLSIRHPTMSFSDRRRRRRDGSTGSGVEK